MSRLALVEWANVGTDPDGTTHWRPDLPPDLTAWAAFDLRGFGVTGSAVAYERVGGGTLPAKGSRFELGDRLEEVLSANRARQIGNRLGIEVVAGQTIGDVLGGLAGAKLLTRQRAPGRFSRRIRLLDQIYEMAPVIRGGATDDFNRADGGLGSSWTAAQNALTISGNKVVVASNPGSMFWNADAFDDDHYSQLDATTNVSGFYMVSAIVRASTTNGGTFYFARVCGQCGDVALGKRVGFSQTEFASGGSLGTSVPTTRDLRLEIVGSDLEAFIGGVSTITATDTDIPTGSQSGIHIATGSATDASIDNWQGDSLGGAPAELPPRPVVVLARTRRPGVVRGGVEIQARPARLLVTEPRSTFRRVVRRQAPRAFRPGAVRNYVRPARLLVTVPVVAPRLSRLTVTVRSAPRPGGRVVNFRPPRLFATDTPVVPVAPWVRSHRVLTPLRPRVVTRAQIADRRRLFADAPPADDPIPPHRRPCVVRTPPASPHVRSVHTFARVGRPFGPDVDPCRRTRVIRSARIVAPPTGVTYSQRQRLFADVPLDAARRPNVRIEVRIPGPTGGTVLYTRAPWRLFTPAPLDARRRPRIIETVRIPFTRTRLLIRKPTPRTFADPPPAIGLCTGRVEISPGSSGAPAELHATGFVTVTGSEGQPVSFTGTFGYGYPAETTATGHVEVNGAGGTIRR